MLWCCTRVSLTLQICPNPARPLLYLTVLLWNSFLFYSSSVVAKKSNQWRFSNSLLKWNTPAGKNDLQPEPFACCSEALFRPPVQDLRYLNTRFNLNIHLCSDIQFYYYYRALAKNKVKYNSDKSIFIKFSSVFLLKYINNKSCKLLFFFHTGKTPIFLIFPSNRLTHAAARFARLHKRKRPFRP